MYDIKVLLDKVDVSASPALLPMVILASQLLAADAEITFFQVSSASVSQRHTFQVLTRTTLVHVQATVASPPPNLRLSNVSGAALKLSDLQGVEVLPPTNWDIGDDALPSSVQYHLRWPDAQLVFPFAAVERASVSPSTWLTTLTAADSLMSRFG